MFSMCSELTPRAHVPDNRIPQLMQPCLVAFIMRAAYLVSSKQLTCIKALNPWQCFYLTLCNFFIKQDKLLLVILQEREKTFNSLAIPFHFTALQQRSPFQTAALQFETLILSDGSTVDCKPAHSHDDDDDDDDDNDDDKAIGNKL